MKRFYLLLALFVLCSAVFAKEPYDPSKWEKDIASFEKMDKEQSISKVDVLFLGSSSIRKWNIKKWFSELNAINRGFGGSQTEDCIYFFDRLVVPYQPEVIVFYEGDNDIGSGKTPERVLNDFKQFFGLMKKKSPGARMIYIAIKPSIKRWNLIENIRKTNDMIHQYCLDKPELEYCNVDPPMIGDDGKPREDIFEDDGLHMNEKGYEIWSTLLEPKIELMLKME